MARPTEFGRDHALDAALSLFWQRGYSATSLADLLEAMGIGRSSFYAAFGDKRQLYVEVLDLFAERTVGILHEVRQESDPLRAVRRFFEHTLFEVPARRAGRGCLLVNTVLELAEVDDGLQRIASRKLDDMEAAFEACFEQARASGQLQADQSPRQLASFIMTMNQGLRVASRKRASRRELHEILDTTLSLLPVAA